MDVPEKHALRFEDKLDMGPAPGSPPARCVSAGREIETELDTFSTWIILQDEGLDSHSQTL